MSVWWSASFIILCAIFIWAKHFLFIKKLTEICSTNIPTSVVKTNFRLLVLSYKITPVEELGLIESEIELLEEDSTFLEKFSDYSLKIFLGLSLTMMGGLATLNISAINLMKDKIPENELMKRTEEALDVFKVISQNYTLLFQFSAVLFAITTLYYLERHQRQKIIKKHLTAIKTLKKFQKED
ncbi:hypothetical protein J2Z22_001601 [Paenibacillus forsythiae]|uniref:MotA/TolQ/ExbB proton channel domain-containing protein n=1 Tax=Paenibacillus forsythiae TaxID=365616 RepID=A0ABU3H5U5_9BACL|nr:hypothetical protein [Paenibacillus forsythiae]MDT3426081.1 hypothetical protein [Paenibacillus forsythiae]